MTKPLKTSLVNKMGQLISSIFLVFPELIQETTSVSMSYTVFISDLNTSISLFVKPNVFLKPQLLGNLV